MRIWLVLCLVVSVAVIFLQLKAIETRHATIKDVSSWTPTAIEFGSMGGTFNFEYGPFNKGEGFTQAIREKTAFGDTLELRTFVMRLPMLGAIDYHEARVIRDDRVVFVARIDHVRFYACLVAISVTPLVLWFIAFMFVRLSASRA